MLGALCARPKPFLFTTLLSLSHSHTSAIHDRRPIRSLGAWSGVSFPTRHHSTTCLAVRCGASASIWHAIFPAGVIRDVEPRRRTIVFHHSHCELNNRGGEGSWNVAWDARPARWLHNPDSAWLLFGVCACSASPPPLPPLDFADSDVPSDGLAASIVNSDVPDSGLANYRVTGVPADGRCLFRAIAHVACLRKGVEAPDENRQKELADELRAKVVDELLRRRKEAEWFIEGDFDAYVKRIRQPYVWGGEPELLMASHVLMTPISVFMKDRSSGSLINISNYGEEYRKDDQSPINVLFHGYGHYDILESIADESYQTVEA